MYQEEIVNLRSLLKEKTIEVRQNEIRYLEQLEQCKRVSRLNERQLQD
jgi:hypothetical protein